LAAGLAGVALVQQPHFASGNRGALSALVASFATAVAMLGLNRIRDVDTRAVVAHFSGVSALACVACFILLPRRPEGLSLIHGASLLKLLGVGVSATAGQLCLTRAFSTGPPTRVALVGLTQVPFAMLLDAVVFGYQFSGWTLLGVALVLLPTAWVMTRR
jgi:drug/metabolite transporter (DMT)-like permease